MSSYPRRVSMIHRPISRNFIVQKIANAFIAGVIENKPATHWAVVVSLNEKYANQSSLIYPKVGEGSQAVRFELVKENGGNLWSETPAWKDGNGFRDYPEDLGGYTWMSDDDIRAIAERTIMKRPLYLNGYSDCQCFAVDLLSRIVDNPSESLRAETTEIRVRRFLIHAVAFVVG